MSNKKIGIIGGVGPQATQVLYGRIIELSQEKYNARNNDDYPSVVIESVPVPDFITSTSEIDIALEMLVEATISLTKAGATVLSIGSNTVHLLLDDLQKVTDVDFISMPALVAERCKSKGYSKVGMLGSPVTLKSGVYEKSLDKEDIEILIPDPKQLLVVDRIIRYVLAGEDNGQDTKEYINILNSLLEKDADGLVLCCTELPLAINYEALSGRIVNSMDVLVENLVDYYFGSER